MSGNNRAKTSVGGLNLSALGGVVGGPDIKNEYESQRDSIVGKSRGKRNINLSALAND